MSFVWTSIIGGGIQEVKAAEHNEVATNVDSIYTYLGQAYTPNSCSLGDWPVTWPISGGYTQRIKSQDYQDMRDRIDWIKDNICNTYDSGYQAGVDTHCPSYNNSEYNGYDYTDKISEDSPYNYGYIATEDDTYQAYYDSNDNTTYYNLENGPNYTLDDSGYYYWN